MENEQNVAQVVDVLRALVCEEHATEVMEYTPEIAANLLWAASRLRRWNRMYRGIPPQHERVVNGFEGILTLLEELLLETRKTFTEDEIGFLRGFASSARLLLPNPSVEPQACFMGQFLVGKIRGGHVGFGDLVVLMHFNCGILLISGVESSFINHDPRLGVGLQAILREAMDLHNPQRILIAVDAVVPFRETRACILMDSGKRSAWPGQVELVHEGIMEGTFTFEEYFQQRPTYDEFMANAEEEDWDD